MRWWKKLSKYTTTIRFLKEAGYDFGLTDYPIFDEAYRQNLNEKILDHYFDREIGFETAGLFKRHLNIKMNEIMPLYNQMYKSELLEIDPFNDYDLVSVTNSESKGENKGYNSDTPQGKLGDIYSKEYATTADNSDSHTKNETTNTIKGKSGGASYSRLLMEFRQTFLNIDMLIVDELEELFMQLW